MEYLPFEKGKSEKRILGNNCNLKALFFLRLSFHYIIFRFYSTNVFEYLCVLFFSSVSLIYFFVFLLIVLKFNRDKLIAIEFTYARALKYSCFVLCKLATFPQARETTKKMAALNFGDLMKHLREIALVSFA